jgi:hypothetical protein
MKDINATHKAFNVVSSISNALQTEIATTCFTEPYGNMVSFDLGYIDDVTYRIDEDVLILATGDNEIGDPKITKQQWRLLCGIAYEYKLTIEEVE